MAGRGGMPPAAWSGVTEAAGTTEAVRRLLDAATAAADREDWSAAVSIAEAAASLDAGDPMVALALARARAGAAAEEPATGTRRRLTIMFCDLAGSTEIASALDPEDTREILHTYHATCAEIIRRYDGHIVHLMGDGALVSFGYPRAHEDDAARAVLAALSIAEAVPALRSPSTGEQWDLKVRVGIHTGLAVVEYLSGASWAQPGEIYGETPNLAARVQTAAAPGTVVISDTTYDMVRDRVDVRPLGPHTLKGIARPVELYEVHAVRADLDARREDPSNVAVVGRQSDREALDQAWEAARGAGAFAVICGEPGIGKSHLLRYVRDMVHSEGGRSVVLRCSALYSNTPLQPVVTLIRAQVDEAGADDPFAALVEVAGTFGLSGDEPLYLLAQLCSVPWPEGRTAPDLLPEQARERTLVMLMAWIDAMAARGPLLLAAEDVHWADPSTLDLLARCVTPERGQPILVVVTTRSDPATVPGDPATVLTLEPLGDTACHKLIDTLTGGRLDRATRALITERGDGVPLYVRELAKMLDADGDPDAEPPPVPPSLNDLLVARLDSFPHARPVLDVLSVLGRPASPGLLGELTGRPAADLATDLAALERAGVVRASTSPTVVDFYHALLRDTAYDVQLLSDRRRLHSAGGRGAPGPPGRGPGGHGPRAGPPLAAGRRAGPGGDPVAARRRAAGRLRRPRRGHRLLRARARPPGRPGSRARRGRAGHPQRPGRQPAGRPWLHGPRGGRRLCQGAGAVRRPGRTAGTDQRVRPVVLLPRDRQRPRLGRAGRDPPRTGRGPRVTSRPSGRRAPYSATS